MNSDRGTVPRQPLGDATNRLNQATVGSVTSRHGLGDDENYLSVKSQNVARGCYDPVVTVNQPSAEHHGPRAPAPTTTEPSALANPRAPATALETRGAADARRVSQTSNVPSNPSDARQSKAQIGPWELGKTLGKGSSARVRLGRHQVSRELVAVKIVAKTTVHLTQAGSLANLDQIDEAKATTNSNIGLRRMPLAIEREVAILKLIGHPNIIQLLDIWENRSEIYLVTEYVEQGDMFEFINCNGPLREEEAIFYYRQIMSALEYCHSFNICHRDLKPENILLKSNGQIKIADFGMAALHQGPNHQLRTACGSPHYAAPELLRHQFYKGSAADIWSMGVILFAMLSGRLPFDDEDMGVMLSKAKRAEYKMPEHLSGEAADLIRRILVHQPAQRITMEQMWNHALLKKYDYLDQYYEWAEQQDTSLRHRDVAPIPEQDVDIQILRQLKALWHSFSEHDLKEKLRQKKPNDQQLFYWLLYNHREAQLENYNNNVPISKSDIHHLKPPNWCKRISTCKFTQKGRNGQGRSVSRFTVISNVPELDDAGTIRSYDPYNSSLVLQPSVHQASHAKIIVHRNGSKDGVGPSPTSVSHSYRSYESATGSFRRQQRVASQRSSARGYLPPLSSVSSIRSYQSISHVRAKNRSKRNVDFSRVRKPNHHSHKDRQRSRPAPASIAGDSTTYDRDALSPSSPKKPKTQRLSNARSMADADGSLIWNEELEQFTHRIAQDCDEAFGSSLLLPDPNEEGADSREESPFNLSLGDLSAVRLSVGLAPTKEKPTEARPWDNRPLPPIPSRETVSPLSVRNTGLNVGIASHAKTASKTDSNFGAQPPERRTVSESVYNRHTKGARFLPSINEDTSENWTRRNLSTQHLTPAPLNTPTRPKGKGLDYLARVGNTIRVVVHSPTAAGGEDPMRAPEPLKIRKVFGNTDIAKPPLPSFAGNTGVGSPEQNQSADGRDSHVSGPPKNRVASWFKRLSKEEASSSNVSTMPESRVQSKDNSPDPNASGLNQSVSQSSGVPSAFRTQEKKPFAFSFWKRIKNEPKMSIAGADLDATDKHDREKSKKKMRKRVSKFMSGTEPTHWSDDSDGSVRKIEVQQNWLARLFRVKPARRYVCFSITKRRARQEVAILLREWRKYGMADIEVDKQRSIIFGRVAADNYLNLKEVSFAIELMTVIEHGKRNHLCIARFTQEKGAASSFHKVVDTIHSVFTNRGLLVSDKRKVSMMIKTLNS